jgi:hypothetical protein
MASKRSLYLVATLLAVIAALIAAFVWLSTNEHDVMHDADTASVEENVPHGAKTGVVVEHSSANNVGNMDEDVFDVPPIEMDMGDLENHEWRPSEKAVASLKDAMRYGDPRTPPLAESTPRELPSEQELADPKLYLEYEARQKEQVYRSFMKASAVKITELEAAIATAERDGGVSEDQLDEGRRKLEALKRSRDEVLAEHPDAAEDSVTAPEEDDSEL